MRMNEFALARDAFARGVEIALAADELVLVAQSLLGVAGAHFHGAEFRAAIETYGVARRYFGAMGHVVAECFALTWIGEAHRSLGDAPAAEASLRAALERYDAAPAQMREALANGQAEVLERLAGLCDATQRREDARALRSRA